jgi:hypothetical protein
VNAEPSSDSDIDAPEDANNVEAEEQAAAAADKTARKADSKVLN